MEKTLRPAQTIKQFNSTKSRGTNNAAVFYWHIYSQYNAFFLNQAKRFDNLKMC